MQITPMKGKIHRARLTTNDAKFTLYAAAYRKSRVFSTPR